MRVRVPKTFMNLTNVQMMRRKVASQKGRVTKLEGSVRQLQHLLKDDILSLQEKASRYKGNDYTTYSDAVVAINEKYNGTADWGVLQTGNIIDLRAAFIINEGPKIVKKDTNAQLEYDWATRFFEYNDLDKEVPQEFAKEAEIEGKLVLKIAIEEKGEAKAEDETEEKEPMISVRFISWTEKRYVIKTAPQDYMQYETCTWKPKNKDKDEVLEAPEFVYKKFGGRIALPNTPAPKVMKCLTQIDDLSKALRDWREINRIFAAPIMGIECETKEHVKSAREAIEDKNWKIKKIFVGMAKLYYAQFDIKGVESLENEIITLSKMIAGCTGVSVQYLGLADLLKNRSTSDDLRDMLVAATTKERETWKGAYEEIIHKAMIMFNNKVNPQMSNLKKLDPSKIGIEIPVVTKEQWEHLEKVLLPACIAGKISDEFFQEKVPGLDLEAEQQRREDREESELENAKKELEAEREKATQKKLFGEEEEEA